MLRIIFLIFMTVIFTALPVAAQTRSVKVTWTKSASSYWKDQLGATVVIAEVELAITTPFTDLSVPLPGMPPLWSRRFPYTGTDSLEIGPYVKTLGGGPWYAWIRVHSNKGLASSWAKSAVFTFGPLPPTNFKVSVTNTFITEPPPPVDAPPAVSFQNLVAGQVLAGTVTLVAAATDDLGIAHVEMFVDGVQRSNTERVTPYEFLFDTKEVADGDRVFTLKATDSAGQVTTSAPVIAKVKNAVAAAGQATLEWDAVTTNVDGTPLNDLAGYKIYQAPAAGGPWVSSGAIITGTSYQVTALPVGTWHFVVTAVDNLGNESSFSNVVFKVIGI